MAYITVFLTLFALHSAFAQLKWMEIKPSSGPTPSVRRDSSIGYDSARNRIVIFGGRSGSTILGDTWMFDLNTTKWTQVADTKDSSNKVIPENRFSVVYGTQGDYFFVSTGEGPSKAFYNDVNRFNFSSLKWEKLQPKSSLRPETRYGSGGGIWSTGNGVYITHGFAGVRYSNTFKFRLDTMVWEKKYNGHVNFDPKLPHSRCLHATAMTGPNAFVLFGGCISGGDIKNPPCPAGDGWKYNGDTNKWTKLNDCATKRTYSAMALLPSNDANTKKVVLYGGNDGSGASSAPSDEIVVFDPNTDKWMKKKIAGTVPAKRFGQVMVTTKDGIIVFGGRNSASGDRNDIWLLKGNALDVDKTPSYPGCDAVSDVTTTKSPTTSSQSQDTTTSSNVTMQQDASTTSLPQETQSSTLSSTFSSGTRSTISERIFWLITLIWCIFL